MMDRYTAEFRGGTWDHFPVPWEWCIVDETVGWCGGASPSLEDE
jgi:hypothetical protein